jgi:undecaprenyl-diphosphatase
LFPNYLKSDYLIPDCLIPDYLIPNFLITQCPITNHYSCFPDKLFPMTNLQAIILGIVQGLTEFLPISSSGHLVLVPHVLGWVFPADQTFVFDVWVQLGTLVAVIVYFWKEIYWITFSTVTSIWEPRHRSRPEVRLGICLLVATIPAVIGGVLLKDRVEQAFSNPNTTVVFLVLTAMLLLIAERAGKRQTKLENITWRDAFWIGLFQILALFPGLSRSGATITGGMLRNLDRRSAARFSFLMSVPIMIGAGVFTIPDLLKIQNLSSFITPIVIGFVTSMIVGYLSIRWLLKYLSNNSFYPFIIYLVSVSLIILLIK